MRHSSHPSRAGSNSPARHLIVLLFSLLVAGVVNTSVSSAAVSPAPHWTIAGESVPTYFTPGDESDYYRILVRNDGSRESSGPVTVTDSLPPGVTATEMGSPNANLAVVCEVATVSCKLGPGHNLVPRTEEEEELGIDIKVSVPSGTPLESVLTNVATIAGGGAPPASVTTQTAVSADPLSVPFGPSWFNVEAVDGSGEAQTQAGSHPYQLTTQFALNSASVEPKELQGKPLRGLPNADPKDIHVELPPGVIGDPSAVPKCSQSEFESGNGLKACPADTQVGWVHLRFYGKIFDQEFPVFNITPPPNQPAELGFTFAGFVHVPMLFHLRTGGDYGLTADVPDISEADVLRSATLSIWGVPAATTHDALRRGAGECDGPDGCHSGVGARPFLTLPTSCGGSPQAVTMQSDSWQGETAAPITSKLPAQTGCGSLSFDPSLTAQPETSQAATPSGYTFDLRVPQNEDPSGLATPNLRKAVVTLPAGTVVSPSAANGLVGCPQEGSEGVNLHSSGAVECPNASKIGTVEVETPLLEKPLKGSVFIAQQGNDGPQQGSNPFNTLMAIYIAAEGSGVVVKLAGKVTADPVSGQLTATFDENPQLPFSDLKVNFFGGSGAALVNPTGCGTYTTTGELTPWSGGSAATRTNSFQISGCTGGGFAPSFTAGTSSNRAGSYSPFSLAFAHQDGEDGVSSITTTLPQGVIGKIAGVPRCSEAEAAESSTNEHACPVTSRIGSVTVAAGPGPSPVYVHGSVYLTDAYGGGPFGEVVVVPAIAGPFNLGTVAVRGAIFVDPNTAQVSVASDPFPTILQGIPLQVKSVDVQLDREGFTFNPTSCAEEATTGTITAIHGASAPVSSRFQAADCASLPFKPVLKASTQASASKAEGASLHVLVTSGTGQANIGKVKVDLPIQLPSRFSTLHKACVAAVFTANPAGCPAASVVGTVMLHTPVLSSALSGPAYLVSHGGAELPDLVFVLQGEGVTLFVTGHTKIKNGVTSESFESVPDAPISSFEASFPEGPYSVLAAFLPTKAKFSFCGTNLKMPMRLTGQNGAVVTQTTNIAVTGCAKAKKARKASRGKARRATVRKSTGRR
jgi:uncharacterized repeat protein (TIGR01451 family)